MAGCKPSNKSPPSVGELPDSPRDMPNGGSNVSGKSPPTRRDRDVLPGFVQCRGTVRDGGPTLYKP